MKEEQYSSTKGTAQIAAKGNDVIWTVDIGGQTYTGSEPIGDDSVDAAMHRARKAVDAFEPPVAEPEPATPAVSSETTSPDRISDQTPEQTPDTTPDQTADPVE